MEKRYMRIPVSKETYDRLNARRYFMTGKARKKVTWDQFLEGML